MRLRVMLTTLRHLLGVEPSVSALREVPRVDTSSSEERRYIDERLSRQQAALAELLASASLDEQRSRGQYHDV
jgi:hypothetical protein